MTQTLPWATCGGCRYIFRNENVHIHCECHVEPPKLLTVDRQEVCRDLRPQVSPGDIACRHYEPRYMPPPKDEETSRAR